ncbi:MULTISPECIES: hypothetical protein [Halobacteriales]|uniref:hypothetical protein n=1 Tax=Halobacteriales TaxID=2235 RepID=UPI00073F02F6|nr:MULTISPECIES: hypothetical protein [Halobacteriales]KAA9396285.1 hypothetical protein Har1130_19700 [Haloarcula sp. CBA1130]KAA9398270.1 hypothetical protein Har1129_08605 [Haloarcula sp. CBA1129]MCG1004599.1 hypothetical protein [Halobacterium noricense]
MVEVTGIGVYSCVKTEGDGNPDPSTVGVLENEDFNDDAGAEASRICEELIDTALGKKYGESKSARNHRFSAEAEVERSDDGESVLDVLEEVRNDGDLEKYSKHIADWYITEIQSRSDLIIVAPFEEHDREFVAVIKTPFLPDAHEIDTDEMFVEHERIIREETDKSIIYPFYDEFEDEADSDRARVYQRDGSQHYAKYWWRFLRLEEEKHPDELVENSLGQRMDEGDGEFDSLDDFTEFVAEEFDTEVGQEATVSVEIANTSFQIPLSEFQQQENVQLAKEGNTYYVVLSGTQPQMTVGSGRNKRSVFDEIDDLPHPSDLF